MLLTSSPSRNVIPEQVPVRDLLAMKLALVLLHIQEAWSLALGKLDKKLNPCQRKWVYSFLLILGLGLAIMPLFQPIERVENDYSARSPATIALPPIVPGEPFVFPDSLSTSLTLNQYCYE